MPHEITPPTIVYEGERALLRWLEHDDFEAMLAICADPVVMRTMGDGTPLTPEQVRLWIERSRQNYQRYGYGTFAVIERASGRLIGFAGLVHPGGAERVELIYALEQAQWGRGLASELAGALIRLGFERWGLTSIVATIDPANLASRRIVEKLGMRYLGERPDEDGLPTAWYEIVDR